ncbi:MAG: HIT family protein [Ignavibacteriaceae bacterium]|nr:HIT family protein [Ignavibacteriaceae bacterium]
MSCIFCDIVNKVEKAEILFEDESTISFLDIRPLNFGHSLVIPKNHYENFFDVGEKDLNAVISSTQFLANAIKKSLAPDGINIISNNGSSAGQTIYHFHFHIIPRFKNDHFTFRPQYKDYSNGLMQQFADKIRGGIKSFG